MLRVATHNVNSIRSRLHLVIPWLRENRPDLLCMQETRVADPDFPAASLREVGYGVVFHGGGGRNGVAIAHRSDLELRDVRFGLLGRDPDRLARARLGDLAVVNVYVPQGRRVDHPMFRYKLGWLSDLLDLLEGEYDPGEPLLVCGDFNVAPGPLDVHSPERLANHVAFHRDARAAFARLLSWGLVDVFRSLHPGEPGYTFYDYRVPRAVERGIGWRVDHVLATEPLAERAADCRVDLSTRTAPRPSDHAVLWAEFDLRQI